MKGIVKLYKVYAPCEGDVVIFYFRNRYFLAKVTAVDRTFKSNMVSINVCNCVVEVEIKKISTLVVTIKKSGLHNFILKKDDYSYVILNDLINKEVEFTTKGFALIAKIKRTLKEPKEPEPEIIKDLTKTRNI